MRAATGITLLDITLLDDTTNQTPAHRGQEACSVSLPDCRIRPAQIIVPTSLIATGAVISAAGWLRPGSGKDPSRKTGKWVDTALEYTPLGMGMIMGFGGVPSEYTIRERMASRLTATLLLTALVQPTKHLVHSTRPNHEDRHSFPSGHTAAAFMGAELMRLHYGPYWAIGGYVAATACGVLRCVNHCHWPADVIAGAGFGILAANAAMWLLPWECKLMPFLTKGRKSLVDTGEAGGVGGAANNQGRPAPRSATGILLPTYSAETKGIGLTFALTF